MIRPSGWFRHPESRERIGQRKRPAVIACLVFLAAAVSSFLAWSSFSIARELPAQPHRMDLSYGIPVTAHAPVGPTSHALVHGFQDWHSPLQDLAARMIGHVLASTPVPADALQGGVVGEAPPDLRGLDDLDLQRVVTEGLDRMKLLLGAFGVFLMIGGACGAVGMRLLSQAAPVPLRGLASPSPAQDTRAGNTPSGVPLGSRDEIGRLSQSFNEVSSKLEFDAVLESVVEQARALLQCQAGGLRLLSAKRTDGAEPAARGPYARDIGCRGEGGNGRASRSASRASCRTLESGGPVLCLRAALRRGEEVLGTLCVGRNEPRTFQPEDRALLEGLAAQAAVALENARLYREVGSQATVQERERIAREIHDGVAQGLAFLHLRLKTLEDRLARGGEPPRLAEVRDMRCVCKRAYVDVRQSVFGLRTSTARGIGLVAAVTEYLREFSRETGIQVEVQDGNPRATDFSPDAEVQLVRVIQEALNNVRKHARARHAWVRFAVDEDMSRVTVEDDGVGFCVESAQAQGGQRFGLRTMRERAEAVGGQLDILSTPRQGTRVVVRMPLVKPGSEL